MAISDEFYQLGLTLLEVGKASLVITLTDKSVIKSAPIELTDALGRAAQVLFSAHWDIRHPPSTGVDRAVVDYERRLLARVLRELQVIQKEFETRKIQDIAYTARDVQGNLGADVINKIAEGLAVEILAAETLIERFNQDEAPAEVLAG